MRNGMLALTLVFIPPLCRVAETATTQVRNLDFVEAARASGAGTLDHRAHHILGNVLAPVFIYASSLVSVCDPARLRPVVPRPGREAADAGLGPDAVDAAPGDLRPADVCALPGVAIFITSIASTSSATACVSHGRQGIEPMTAGRPEPSSPRSAGRSARPRRQGPAAADRTRPQQAFPDPRRHAQPPGRPGARGRRRVVHRAQGRDARHRRRVRLRQVHARAAADAPDRRKMPAS